RREPSRIPTLHRSASRDRNPSSARRDGSARFRLERDSFLVLRGGTGSREEFLSREAGGNLGPLAHRDHQGDSTENRGGRNEQTQRQWFTQKQDSAQRGKDRHTQLHRCGGG